MRVFMVEPDKSGNLDAKKRCKYCGLTTKHLRGCPMNPFRHKLAPDVPIGHSVKKFRSSYEVDGE